jgi:hypothetical protein
MYIGLVLISNTTALKTTAIAIIGRNRNFAVEVLLTLVSSVKRHYDIFQGKTEGPKHLEL